MEAIIIVQKKIQVKIREENYKAGKETLQKSAKKYSALKKEKKRIAIENR